MINMLDVQRGYDAWAVKPHNAKWARKIDGTPIANDIVATIWSTLRDTLEDQPKDSSVSRETGFISGIEAQTDLEALVEIVNGEFKIILSYLNQLHDDISSIQAKIDRAARTPTPETIPRGYLLMPVKPTPEMIKAGEKWSGLAEQIWQDMIDASVEPDASNTPSPSSIVGGIPAGWKLVPIEPTLDMVMAGETAWERGLDARLDAKPRIEYPSEEVVELAARVSYRAMINAAPSSEVSE